MVCYRRLRHCDGDYQYHGPIKRRRSSGCLCHYPIMLSSTCNRVVLLLMTSFLLLHFGGYCQGQPLRHSPATTTSNSNSSNSNSSSAMDTAILIYPLQAISGTLHVDIWIGQPAVLQTMIVDTGSRFTATPCSDFDQDHDDYCGGGTSTSCRRRRRRRRASGGTKSNINNKNGQHHHAHAILNASSASLRRTVYCPDCRLTNDVTESCSSSTGGTDGRVRGEQQHQQQCIIQQAYTEGSSWTAIEVNDIVALAGESSSSLLLNTKDTTTTTRKTTSRQRQYQQYQYRQHQYQYQPEIDLNYALSFTFGCQFQVQGLFIQQYANGILGLLPSHHSLVEHMTRNGIIQHASFSLCIGSTDMDSTSATTSSWLGLGGALKQFHLSEMKFTYMPNKTTTSSSSSSTTTKAATTGHFSVLVEQVWLGHDFDILVASIETTPEIMRMGFQSGKGTILDSGTTDTYLPLIMRTAMEQAWHNYTTTRNNGNGTGSPLFLEYDSEQQQRSYMYTYDDFHRYIPPIHLVLHNNVILTLDPFNYMEGARSNNDGNNIPWKGRRKLTNRIYVDELTGAVLGLNAMMGHDFYFENKKKTTTNDNANNKNADSNSYQQQRIGIAPANCVL